MTQSQLNTAVARATGEDRRTICRLGFNIADPEMVDFDPEGNDRLPLTMDWDEFDRLRDRFRPV